MLTSSVKKGDELRYLGNNFKGGLVSSALCVATKDAPEVPPDVKGVLSNVHIRFSSTSKPVLVSRRKLVLREVI